MSNTLLTLAAACEQHMVASEVSSQRMIEWIVSARAPLSSAERAPLNIALIIDRSGSMQGAKLRYVQQAACHLLDQLAASDRVSLVAYDDTIQVLSSGTLVTATARDELKTATNALTPGGATDLSGGWLEGCRAVAAHLAAQGINRALLLTDGLANRGITDVEELGKHARELRQRGVATSTFGVGLDFNEQLLELLAEQGGGHFYFIERPEQIPEFFRQELGELMTVVAREAVLEIGLPRGVAVDVIGELPHERDGERLRLFFGDLFAGERRAIYTRVLTPPDAPGATVYVRGKLSYADLDAQTQAVESGVDFGYARQAEVMLLPVQQALLGRAGEVELAAVAQQALKLERAGQRQQAATLLRASVAANAPVMPAPIAASYSGLAEQLDQGIDESTRKQAHFDSYRTRQSRK